LTITGSMTTGALTSFILYSLTGNYYLIWAIGFDGFTLSISKSPSSSLMV
jgi:hypothetical protein